jgi:DNA-directed RNA polymerase subunit M/transcription elongation factor TFIIS
LKVIKVKVENDWMFCPKCDNRWEYRSTRRGLERTCRSCGYTEKLEVTERKLRRIKKQTPRLPGPEEMKALESVNKYTDRDQIEKLKSWDRRKEW